MLSASPNNQHHNKTAQLLSVPPYINTRPSSKIVWHWQDRNRCAGGDLQTR